MKYLAGCVFSILAGLAAPAAAETVWRCDFAEIGQGGVIVSGPVEVRYVSGAETAALLSTLTDGVQGKAVEAKLMKETDKQVVVGWDLRVKNDINQHTTLRYRLNIVQGGKTATLIARPLGYDNTFSNGGTCRKGKG